MDDPIFQDELPDDEKQEKPSAGYWAGLAAVAIVLAMLVALLPSVLAWADEFDTDPAASEFQQEVERTAAEYNQAKAAAAEARKAAEDNAARIEELSGLIPDQEQRSWQAAREQYKMQRQRNGLVEIIVDSESFSDFLAGVDYVSRLFQANTQEMTRLYDMRAELRSKQTELQQAQERADDRAREAKEALEAAQGIRREAQGRAQEEARRQAEAMQFAAAIDDARSTEDPADGQDAPQPDASGSALNSEPEGFGGEEDSGHSISAAGADDSTGKSSPKSQAPATEETKGSRGSQEVEASGQSQGQDESDTPDASDDAAPSEDSLDDGADWNSEEEAFIAEWGSRIDAYLSGSALSGQGETFARAAWNYGVDPRWSPAISTIESSKGAYCFLPHNAWGWGDVSWSSWEEAIDSHVAGLARGYGYTISVAAAQKYCPPNWEHWYNTTLSEMDRI